MARSTAESFLNAVRQSDLIAPDVLKRTLDSLKRVGDPLDDPRALAETLVERKLLTAWQAEKLLQGRHRGFFLGKYRLLSLLGKGGMSSVYLAEHVLMRRRCAIKVLPQKRVKDSSYLGRFHREARAVAALDHSNIVRAYDVDSEADKETEIHFLVMEYVEGESLQELMARRGQLDYAEAAEFIRQAALGLAHAHENNMVHRDIKPGNLLVDRRGVVKILDLGLARFFADDGEQSLTVAHDEKVLGTADYLSPEQALDSHRVDARADIYGLGCTFYFLLAGHPPFTEGTLAQRLLAHQTKQPPPVTKDRPDAPRELVAVIEKMMAKEPAQRFQTAQEVAEVLERWIVEHGGSPGARPEPLLVRNGSAARRAGTPPESGSGGSAASPGSAASLDSAAEPAEPGASNPPEHDGSLAAFLSNLESDSGNLPRSEGRAAGSAGPGSSALRKSAAVETGRKTRPSAGAGGPQGSRPQAPDPVPVAQPVTAGQSGTPSSRSVPVAQAVPVPSAGAVRTAISLKDETFPESSHSFAKEPAVGRPPVSQRSGQSKTAKMAVIAGVAVFAAIAVGAAFWFLGDRGDEPGRALADERNGDGVQPDFERRSAGVITVGSDGQFKTIGEAIVEATERYNAQGRRTHRQTIRVSGGETYPERIEIDNSTSELDDLVIRVVSAGAKPAVLAPNDSGPAVRLIGVKRFTLEGFEIRAEKRKVAIELAGYCAGTVLRNLEITGFSESGIAGKNLTGFSAGNEVGFDGLVFRPAAPAAVGVRFGTGSTQQVSIRGCRFVGPMSAGVLLSGEARYVRIEQSIFSGGGDGIRFQPPGDLFDVAIGRNTFHKLNGGVVLTEMPSRQSRELRISENLFAEIKGPDATIRGTTPDPELIRTLLSNPQSGLKTGNWTTRTEPARGELPLLYENGRRGVQPSFISTDPESPQFLLPSVNIDHAAVGAGGVKQK